MIYCKIPTVLHYRGYIKRNRDVNILLQGLTSKKTNRECLPLTKYTENTEPEIMFSGLTKKNEIGKNQSGNPIEQDINLVWPYIHFLYVCSG